MRKTRFAFRGSLSEARLGEKRIAKSEKQGRKLNG